MPHLLRFAIQFVVYFLLRDVWFCVCSVLRFVIALLLLAAGDRKLSVTSALASRAPRAPPCTDVTATRDGRQIVDVFEHVEFVQRF